MILGFYYGSTEIEHEPALKYPVQSIMQYLKMLRSQGYEFEFQDALPDFYEFHNYSIKTGYDKRFVWLVMGNMLATVMTNPIDVCLSKMLTQNDRRYTGLFNALKEVYKEEGAWKFTSGVHPRFMFNLYNGLLFLFVYDRFV